MRDALCNDHWVDMLWIGLRLIPATFLSSHATNHLTFLSTSCRSPRGIIIPSTYLCVDLWL